MVNRNLGSLRVNLVGAIEQSLPTAMGRVSRLTKSLQTDLSNAQDRLKAFRAEQRNTARGSAEWNNVQQRINGTQQEINGLTNRLALARVEQRGLTSNVARFGAIAAGTGGVFAAVGAGVIATTALVRKLAEATDQAAIAQATQGGELEDHLRVQLFDRKRGLDLATAQAKAAEANRRQLTGQLAVITQLSAHDSRAASQLQQTLQLNDTHERTIGLLRLVDELQARGSHNAIAILREWNAELVDAAVRFDDSVSEVTQGWDNITDAEIRATEKAREAREEIDRLRQSLEQWAVSNPAEAIAAGFGALVATMTAVSLAGRGVTNLFGLLGRAAPALARGAGGAAARGGLGVSGGIAVGGAVGLGYGLSRLPRGETLGGTTAFERGGRDPYAIPRGLTVNQYFEGRQSPEVVDEVAEATARALEGG